MYFLPFCLFSVNVENTPKFIINSIPDYLLWFRSLETMCLIAVVLPIPLNPMLVRCYTCDEVWGAWMLINQFFELFLQCAILDKILWDLQLLFWVVFDDILLFLTCQILFLTLKLSFLHTRGSLPRIPHQDTYYETEYTEQRSYFY